MNRPTSGRRQEYSPALAPHALGMAVGVALMLASLASASADKDDDELDPERREWSILPVVSSSSDFGLGLGVIGQMSQFAPKRYPYRWRAGGLIFVAGEPGAEGGVDSTLQYHRLEMDLPQFLHENLRLSLVASYLRQVNAGYFGIGNASGEDQMAVALEHRHHQYDLRGWVTRPSARLRLNRRTWLWFKGELAYRDLMPYAGSRLQQDLALAEQDTPEGRELARLLLGVDTHWLKVAQLGVLWDTRNHEFAPSRGMYHEFSGRIGHFDGNVYGGINATARFFHPLRGRYAILALRLTLDQLWGRPPMYRLSGIHGLLLYSGIGGEFAIRGTPEGRYHGKLKVMGNLELRSSVYTIRIKEQRFTLGGVGFFDFGRIWTDPGQGSALDRAPASPDGLRRSGTLKYSFGAGLRVRWGETFVVRLDVGRSVDAVGYILVVNHHF